ncbi:hypothetical protein CC1G_03599 [Coprinopsis cinerea okayama7|uniref:Uncharacterized protein n=1 Tax=Coprinopsis cinerea (strain Okayama-7 / 130 / ATCC MYA-4618 / FGSC 9003) TaxID=240176 RepID=A8NCP1_COPC7|nr:hypothetical protein CC1G_03599 [Coprinopsis cinerea okayama7\|eukprot:XP_001832585.2 hypothetical protein CC1G_03599 [Coprinopsis cinerea okayama7\
MANCIDDYGGKAREPVSCPSQALLPSVDKAGHKIHNEIRGSGFVSWVLGEKRESGRWGLEYRASDHTGALSTTCCSRLPRPGASTRLGILMASPHFLVIKPGTTWGFAGGFVIFGLTFYAAKQRIAQKRKAVLAEYRRSQNEGNSANQ